MGSSGEGSYHGVFVAAGPEPTTRSLRTRRKKLDGFQMRLVEAADLEWVEVAQHDVHHGSGARAARELWLEKPVGVRPEADGGLPGVRREDPAVSWRCCRTCGAILDREKAAKFGLAERKRRAGEVAKVVDK